jgi:hypothetical protein
MDLVKEKIPELHIWLMIGIRCDYDFPQRRDASSTGKA